MINQTPCVKAWEPGCLVDTVFYRVGDHFIWLPINPSTIADKTIWWFITGKEPTYD